MRIAEIYESRQGEGLLTGTPSVFVRASGCNLRCRFCDTPFTSWEPEGDDLSVDQIVSSVRGYAARHVVITGGEPMLFAELLPLTDALSESGLHLTIETAGTLYLPVRCDLMSISPKLTNSTPSAEMHPQWHHRHERTRHVPDVIRRLIVGREYQFKFVVESRSDCDEIEAYLADFPELDRGRVLLMPQGTNLSALSEIARWLVPLSQDRGLRYCPRMQIAWYGHRRGT
jgi:7-carboxy-7-deazaguanine synthase